MTHGDKAVRTRRYTLLLMGASALIVLFLLFRMGSRGQKAAAPTHKTVVVADAPPTPVTLTPVKLGTLTDTAEVSGDIAALSEVTLRSF